MTINQYKVRNAKARTFLSFVEFTWLRDVNGYRLWRYSDSLRVVGSGVDVESYKPLESHQNLFGEFASIPPTPNGVLDFITKFGPLTQDGQGEKGEDVETALQSAKDMAQLLRAAQLKTLPIGLSALPRLIRLTPQIGNQTSGVALKLLPETLLDAMWLQLTLALAGGCQMRHCDQCGMWFPVGGEFGRRKDAKFCSDEHQVLFNSRKRTARHQRFSF